MTATKKVSSLAMLLSNLPPKFNGFLQMEIKGTVIAIGGFLLFSFALLATFAVLFLVLTEKI